MAASERLQGMEKQKQHIVLEKMAGQNHKHFAVVGNVDAGKSTLIGTLSTNTLDDGRGFSRSKIVKHKHEKETGRTSSINTYLMGMNEDCRLVAKKNTQAEIVLEAKYLVTLHDLAGHEKYLKTTIGGVCQAMADYALVLVNAAQPPTHMTLHHLKLCVSMGVPVVVVMTKMDHCPPHVFQETKAAIQTILRHPDIGCKLFTVANNKDIEIVKDKTSFGVTPLVSISCVSGQGLDILQSLMAALPKRRQHSQKQKNKPFEYLVEDCFQVQGIGTVLSGFVSRGEWKKGEPIYIGPMKDGTLLQTVPKSVHVAQTCVDHVWAGHSVCFALKLPKGCSARNCREKKGMVAMKEPFDTPKSFSAVVELVKGNTLTIEKNRFVAVLHVLHNQLTAKVTHIQNSQNKEQSVIRQGNRATMTFEFAHRPAYVRPGMRVVLRDGHVRGYGVIVHAEA